MDILALICAVWIGGLFLFGLGAFCVFAIFQSEENDSC